MGQKRKKSRAKGKNRERGTDPAGTTSQLGPWRIRFSKQIDEEDADDVGYSGMQRARNAIERKLKIDPVGYGEFLRKELHPLFKLKTTDIRIIYHVDAEKHEVWVLAIGNRRTIYEEVAAEIWRRKGALETELNVRLADDASMTVSRTRRATD